MKVGIIGVGLMGHGIASNILKHGHELCFLAHDGNQPVDDLLQMGASGLPSPAQVAEASDVVITVVTGSPQVRAVMTGDNGLIKGLKPGQLVIDCSTAIPDETRALAQLIEQAGGRLMDAAMTRTPKEAEEGRLNLILGGADAVVAEAMPLLQCFAENIVHVGPVGAGHQMKLIHNFVSLGFSAVMAEAAACSRRAGVATDRMLEVIGKGGGGGVIFDRMRPFMESGDTNAFTFSIANAHKDMGYYLSMVEAMGASREAARAVLDIYRAADEGGHGTSTVPELISLMED